MKKILPHPLVHLILLSIYPVIALFASNLHQILLSEIFVPQITILTISLLLVLIIKMRQKNTYYASLVVSSIVFLTFSYGPLFKLLKTLPVIKQNLNYFHLWLIFILILIILFNWYKKNIRLLAQITRYLNIIALILIVIPGMTISSYFLDNFHQKIVAQEAFLEEKIQPPPLQNLPDIYYLIFDRYAASSTLKKVYGFNNEDFSNYLKNTGFYVMENSWANYYSSAHSLASSLNLEYLDSIINQYQPDDKDWKPINNLLQNHRLGKIMRKLGYQYYHFGSWWWPTSKNKYADKNINLTYLSEFSKVLLENTLFYPIAEKFHLPFIDNRLIQWRRINYAFDQLSQIAQIKAPTFVFAHMIIPHEPYVFDKNGNFLTNDQEISKDNKVKYKEQVIFLNKKITSFIEKAINKNKNPPIIIIQSDEGPYPESYEKGKNSFQWQKAKTSEIVQKLSIFNAIYLPDGNYQQFDQSTTPVNTFRIIFNQYFNGNFQLLKNKFYLGNMKYPYNLWEYKLKKGKTPQI